MMQTVKAITQLTGAVQEKGAPETKRHDAAPNWIPTPPSILAIVHTGHSAELSDNVVELATGLGASVAIYDLQTGSLWTTPFEGDAEGRQIQRRALSAPQLQSLGHNTTARVVNEIERVGIQCGAYLATRPCAGDLSELVAQRDFDAIVNMEPLRGRTARNVERAMLSAATLRECSRFTRLSWDKIPSTASPYAEYARR